MVGVGTFGQEVQEIKPWIGLAIRAGEDRSELEDTCALIRRSATQVAMR